MSELRRILVIGIGAGNPDYMTVQAIDALNRVDVFFIPDKGAEKAELRELRETICRRFITRPGYRMVDFDVPLRKPAEGAYPPSIDAWRHQVEGVYAALLERELAPDQCGAFLVWGDPSLYDGTLRILDGLKARGTVFEHEVIPGITAVQALAARHRTALNGVGEPVLITTGRRLAGVDTAAPNVAVMLDAGDALVAVDDDREIVWGAYLGMPGERLVAGRLGDVRDEIGRQRAAGRAEHGWIMDTYLLRRGAGSQS